MTAPLVTFTRFSRLAADVRDALGVRRTILDGEVLAPASPIHAPRLCQNGVFPASPRTPELHSLMQTTIPTFD